MLRIGSFCESERRRLSDILTERHYRSTQDGKIVRAMQAEVLKAQERFLDHQPIHKLSQKTHEFFERTGRRHTMSVIDPSRKRVLSAAAAQFNIHPDTANKYWRQYLEWLAEYKAANS